MHTLWNVHIYVHFTHFNYFPFPDRSFRVVADLSSILYNLPTLCTCGLRYCIMQWTVCSNHVLHVHVMCLHAMNMNDGGVVIGKCGEVCHTPLAACIEWCVSHVLWLALF